MLKRLCCASIERSRSSAVPNYRLVDLSGASTGYRTAVEGSRGGFASAPNIFDRSSRESSLSPRTRRRNSSEQFDPHGCAPQSEASISIASQPSQESMGNITSRVKKRLSRDAFHTNFPHDVDATDGKCEEVERWGRRSRLLRKRKSRKHMLSDQSIGEDEFDPDAVTVDMQSLIRRIIDKPTSNLGHTRIRPRKEAGRPRLRDLQSPVEKDEHSPGSESFAEANHIQEVEAKRPLLDGSGSTRLRIPQAISSRSVSEPKFTNIRSQTPVPEFRLNPTLRAPPTPKLEPVRFPSVTPSVESNQWRLSKCESTSSLRHRPCPSLPQHVGSLRKASGSVPEAHTISCSKEDWTNPHTGSDPGPVPFQNLESHSCQPMQAGVKFDKINRPKTNAFSHGATSSGHGATSSQSSIHLSNMRISHHLRSVSSLSVCKAQRNAGLWQSFNSDMAEASTLGPSERRRHQLQTSNSGFESTKVPLTRDDVVSDEASSIYSVRPNSPVISPAQSIQHQSMQTKRDPFESAIPSIEQSNTSPAGHVAETPQPSERGTVPRISRFREQSEPAMVKKKASSTFNLSKLMSKSKSMTFGLTALKTYAKLIKSPSLDFRKMDAISQASASASEDAEKETPAPFPHNSPAQSDQSQNDVPGTTAGIQLLDSEATSVPTDAKRFSQLYQSCVEFPGSSEDTGVLSPPESLEFRRPFANSLPWNLGSPRQHARNFSVQSGNTLRKSTIDFCKLLEETEASEREKVLQAAEKSWSQGD